MTITTYSSFAKKRNSTKQPTGGTSHTALLKEPCSIENPAFKLRTSDNNITYVSAFGHYYFVDDAIRISNEDIELHCSCDALASHKSEITASNQYVARCETSTYWNTKLIDESYPLATDPDIYYQSIALPFSVGNGAALILAIKGANGTSFWAMAREIFGELGDDLYTMSQDQDSIWSAITASAPFERAYLDPMDYITDAKIIPIDTSLLLGTSYSSIDIGYWSHTDRDQARVYKKLTGQIIYSSTEYTLTLHTRFSGQFEFMNSNRYRKYELNLPGVGNVELDGDQVLTGNNIKVRFSIDTVGGICYEIAYGAGNVYKDYVAGNISIPFAVHGQSADYSRAIGASTGVIGGLAGGAITGGMAGGPVGAVIGGVIGAVGGAAKTIASAGPLFRTQTVGADGSFARMDMNSNILLKETIYNVSGHDTQRLGAPCMQPVLLSNLSGYVQCINASVDINGFSHDREAVEAFLNSGFYIE